MVECCAAGMTVADFWVATQRETLNFLAGAAVRRRRDRQLAVFTAWHVEGFSRTKHRLPNLAQLLRQMEPARVMSPTKLREAIIEAARKSGANVVYIPRKSKGD